MERKALLILLALIVGASTLALGCTGQNGTGTTATPTSDAIAPSPANDTSDFPPLPPSDVNDTFSGAPTGLPGNDSGMPPGLSGYNSTVIIPPALPGDNITTNGIMIPAPTTGT